jgi:hypothetical protein
MFGLRKKIGRIIEGENSNCVTSSAELQELGEMNSMD